MTKAEWQRRGTSSAGVFTVRRWVGLGAGVSLSLAACGPLLPMKAPSPEGPEISELRFLPARTTAGCPVKVSFRFETTGNVEIVQAVAGWTLRRGRVTDSGYLVLPLEPGQVSGRTAGLITTPLTAGHEGPYWYYLQVEDRAGRWSEVVKEQLTVAAQESGGPPKCP